MRFIRDCLHGSLLKDLETLAWWHSSLSADKLVSSSQLCRRNDYDIPRPMDKVAMGLIGMHGHMSYVDLSGTMHQCCMHAWVPPLTKSLHYKHNNTVEIWNWITLDFYTGLPHMYIWVSLFESEGANQSLVVKHSLTNTCKVWRRNDLPTAKTTQWHWLICSCGLLDFRP